MFVHSVLDLEPRGRDAMHNLIIVTVVLIGVGAVTWALSSFFGRKNQVVKPTFDKEAFDKESEIEWKKLAEGSCYGSLNSLVILSFSGSKSTREVLSIAEGQGLRVLQGDEVAMFTDLNLADRPDGLYVNLLDFEGEVFGSLFRGKGIPTNKVLKFEQAWEGNTYFLFVRNLHKQPSGVPAHHYSRR